MAATTAWALGLNPTSALLSRADEVSLVPGVTWESASARLAAVVVLPTPPLPEATAMMFLTPSTGTLPPSGLAAARSVRAVLHPHVGTMVENGDEVRRVLQLLMLGDIETTTLLLGNLLRNACHYTDHGTTRTITAAAGTSTPATTPQPSRISMPTVMPTKPRSPSPNWA